MIVCWRACRTIQQPKPGVICNIAPWRWGKESVSTDDGCVSVASGHCRSGCDRYLATNEDFFMATDIGQLHYQAFE